MIRPASRLASETRRGIILLVVISFLTLFAVIGLSFVLYATSASTAARYFRESHSQRSADLEPELLFAYFLGQFLYDVPDDATGVYSGLRGYGLCRNMFGLNYAINPDGTFQMAANHVPFNGTGRLHYPGPLDQDDFNLINYTYFRADNFLRDPERFGARPELRKPSEEDNRGPYLGGFNATYTYPDLNNLFLAVVKAGPTLLPGGSEAPAGTVLMPSFHRPWLFGKLTEMPDSTPNTGVNPNWTNALGKYLILRPRPIDMGPGFSYPEDEGGDVKNLIGGPGYYDSRTNRLHNNDSLWLDLDFPVMVGPDGRKFKPLFAPLVIDLDNRVNPNVHGNLRGLNNDDHASNSGWGPWEVNLARILNQNPSEWKALLRGNQVQAGRFGRDPWPHSTLENNMAEAGKVPQFYAPIDFDGSNEEASGTPSHQVTLPGIFPSAPYQCFPTVPAGYGNCSDTERTNHPKLYNPFQPTGLDQSFALSNMEALLRYGDTGSPGLTSDVFRLCPENFGDESDPDGAARRRGLVTLRSVDPDRPGITPWFWPEKPKAYNHLGTTSRNPVGSAVGFPGLPGGLPPRRDSEFGADWRAAATLTALRRIDLNRYLPDYPKPEGGRIIDLDGFRVAQQARQHMAAEIFECLWKVTGADNPALVRPPPPNADRHRVERWEALRFLAQLAVNIVDFIDNDDYITPFNWYPANGINSNGEWVYGTELPRLVINEAYIQVDNDANDPRIKPPHPKASYYKINFWVELFNPLSRDAALSDNGDAVLQVGDQAVYQIVLSQEEPLLRDRNNVLGTPTRPKNIVSAYDPSKNVVQPSNGVYAGPMEGNQGFYVLGPQANFLPDASPNLPATSLNANMSYHIPARGTPFNRHTIVLRRLACPHLRYNDPASGTYNPHYPLNPYVTVDYMEKVWTNDGRLYDHTGRRDYVTPMMERASWGRKQPYAAHWTQHRKQQPKRAELPLNQPQHTFFQHNADADTPGPNWRDPPPDYPAFDWLLHLDRPLVSPIELVHVSAFKPHELLQQFVTGNQRYNHRAYWFDEDLSMSDPDASSHRLYRAFEFLETRSQIIGLMSTGTRSRFKVEKGPGRTVFPMALSGRTATGGTWQIEVGCSLVIDQGVRAGDQPLEEVVRVTSVNRTANPPEFTASFLKAHQPNFTITPVTISERLPGKININTVWDEDIFQALCDPQLSNSFTPEVVSTIFQNLKALRNPPGSSPSPEIPGMADAPFRSLATGVNDVGENVTLPSNGINDTLFRPGTTSDRQPLLGVPGMDHPYQTYELMNKIFNHVTIRSNVFAVWITVGFFEVTDDQARPVKLGTEIGRDQNRHIRHRMFAVVDRSHLMSNPGPQPRFNPRSNPSPRAAGLLVPYFSIIE
jgi:hypothetical protein